MIYETVGKIKQKIYRPPITTMGWLTRWTMPSVVSFVTLFANSSSGAELCAGLFFRIPATKGIEVEWQPVRSDLERKNVHPMVEDMAFPLSRELTDFNRMRLAELFGLYGYDEKTGRLKENLLPRIITENPRFQHLAEEKELILPAALTLHPLELMPSERREYDRKIKEHQENTLPFKIEIVDGQYYISNFKSLRGEQLRRTLRLLFDIAGPKSNHLVLQKRPEAWLDKTSAADRLIPNRVVIEMRNGKSAGLEWPMAGAVHSEQEVREYVINLWVRLGLFHKNEIKMVREAASNTLVHLHWVPQIQSVAKESRQRYYRAIVNLMGDLNDEATIRDYSRLADQFSEDHSDKFHLFNVLWHGLSQFMETLQQVPIKTYTRSLARRLVATSNGVFEKDRPVTNEEDPHFSDDLKFLHYGLRSKYNQETYPPDSPVPIVGIEFRNAGTLDATMRQMHKVETRFHEKVPQGDRGIEDDPARLKKLAADAGIDQRVVVAAFESFDSGFAEARKSDWPREVIIGTLLLPLTPWESHPLFRDSLSKLDETARAKVTARYQLAMEEYRKNVNGLIAAFYSSEPKPNEYQIPDWLTPWNPQSLFAIQGTMIIGRYDNIEINQQGQLLQLTLYGELLRFLKNSHLSSLIKNRTQGPADL